MASAPDPIFDKFCPWCLHLIQRFTGAPYGDRLPASTGNDRSSGLCERCYSCEYRGHPDLCDCADGVARKARAA